MAKRTIPIQRYYEVASVFHWATKRHYQLWFTGQESKRHRRSEKVLPRLVKKGKLVSHRYGSKLIYKKAKRGMNFLHEINMFRLIEHGLGCTETLVRFFRSDIEGMAIGERHFVGLGVIPDGGILYPDGKILLFEFTTKHNFYYSGNMNSKLGTYKTNLSRIEKKFLADGFVVFIVDIPKETLERYVLELSQAGSVSDALHNAFFVDYKTFLTVPIGQQLTAPIYLWGADGKSYPLRKPCST